MVDGAKVNQEKENVLTEDLKLAAEKNGKCCTVFSLEVSSEFNIQNVFSVCRYKPWKYSFVVFIESLSAIKMKLCILCYKVILFVRIREFFKENISSWKTIPLEIKKWI